MVKVLRRNLHPDPRGTAFGAPWGYQLGAGEAATTALVTPTTPKRTNLVANPRALGRAWGKAGSTGVEDRPTSGGPLGRGYQRYTPATATTASPVTLAPSNAAAAAAPVVAGRTYTFSAYGRALGQAAAMSIDLSVNFYDAAGANLTADSGYRYTNPGAWTRYAKTLVAPAGAAFALLTMRFSIAAAQFVAGGELGADHFMVEEVAELGGYFDGDTPAAGGVSCAWSGPANASASTATFDDGPVLPDGSRIGSYIRRTITAPKTGNSSGPWCRVPNGTYALLPGDQVSPTMYVRFSVPVTVTVQSSVRAGSGNVTAANQPLTIPANTWTRVGQMVTATAAGDNTQVWAVLAAGTVLPAGTTVDTTAAQSESGGPTPYFDGSSLSDVDESYAWQGPANASPSIAFATPGLWVEPLTDAPGPRAGVTVDGLDTAGPSVVTLWRSSPGGKRRKVRGWASRVVYGSGYVEDVEVPLGRPVTYELQVHSGAVVPLRVADVVTLDTQWGSVQDPLVPSSMLPLSPQTYVGGVGFVTPSLQELTYEMGVELASILGSDEPVGLGGQRLAATGIDFRMVTDVAERSTALGNLLRQAYPLLIRPLPSWGDLPDLLYASYPAVVDATPRRVLGGRLFTWQVSGGTLVAPQSINVVVPIWTYADVEALWATYADAQAGAVAANATYMDVLKDPTLGGA